MKKEILKRPNSKKESIYIFIIILILLFNAAFLIVFTKKGAYHKNLRDNQIISTKLNNNESLIYSKLKDFAFEYTYLKEDYKDLSIDVLKNELCYSPFYAENEVESKIKWYRIKENDNVYYIAISKDKNIVGDFVLNINEEDFKYSIKYINNFTEFKEGINIHKFERLLSNLKEIISYTADDYIKELKGK